MIILFSQFELPYVQILRVKEFKFREVPASKRLSEEERGEHERSVDNLMQVRGYRATGGNAELLVDI